MPQIDSPNGAEALSGATARPIAITLGDPAGIGPEIIARAFRQCPDVLRGCFVVGDVATLRRASSWVADGGAAWPICVLNQPADSLVVPSACLPVLPVHAAARDAWAEPVPMGRVSARAGALAGACVVWAAQAALRAEVAAMVTAPLNKAALALAGAPYDAYPGHTEMLQAIAAEHRGCALTDMPVRMMLANPELRVVLVTIHMSLRDALDAITFDAVLGTLRITHASLQRGLGRAPRIGVAGLNPHAGEGGLFGTEEQTIIAPAVQAARVLGMDVSDPQPPDTVFMRARRGAYDVVVAMTHDQGLIPVKYLGVEQGVNVTLGLPLVRTSPDHGTAFDIAGQGRADPSSLIEAVQWARRLATVSTTSADAV